MSSYNFCSSTYNKVFDKVKLPPFYYFCFLTMTRIWYAEWHSYKGGITWNISKAFAYNEMYPEKTGKLPNGDLLDTMAENLPGRIV